MVLDYGFRLCRVLAVCSMLLRTTIDYCRYSQNTLRALKMIGSDELAESELLSDLHCQRHHLHNLKSGTLLPIESSLREIMDWYMEMGLQGFSLCGPDHTGQISSAIVRNES